MRLFCRWKVLLLSCYSLRSPPQLLRAFTISLRFVLLFHPNKWHASPHYPQIFSLWYGLDDYKISPPLPLQNRKAAAHLTINSSIFFLSQSTE